MAPHQKIPLFTRRVQLLGLLSVASGMPLGWVFNSLQFFLVDLGINKATIGVLSGVSLPWTLKFLWSPLVDRYALSWPGRRRSWIIVTQLALGAAFGGLAAFAAHAVGLKQAGQSMEQVAFLIGGIALGITFLSATQDIAIDAFAVETLEPQEQGPVSGLRIMYYRLGMIVAGAAAVSASDLIGWPAVFLLLGVLFVAFIGVTLAAPEPAFPAAAPRSLAKAVVEPFVSYFSRPDAIAVALFLIFYKFGDNLGGTMVNPFLKDLCFTNAEAGFAVKTVGLVSTILGAGVGAAFMPKLGLGRSLWVFGVLQAGANLLYSVAATTRGVPLEVTQCAALPALALVPRAWTYVAIAAEYGAQGMATAAQGALLLRVCDKRFGATQFALLSSLFGLGRWVAGLPSGWLAVRLGYPVFFVVCATLAAAPGFYFLSRIAPLRQREVLTADANPPAG